VNSLVLQEAKKYSLLTGITRQAQAGVAIDVIKASCVVEARVRITFISVFLTRITCAI
jgi:hypothetical protein